MKARILAVGQKMPTWVQTGCNDYLKRIQPMLNTEIVEIPAYKRSKNPSAAELEKYALNEGGLILQAHANAKKERLICLDVRGKNLSTEDLAKKISDAMQVGDDMGFVIGGADGLSKEVLAKADFKWSLSNLTLPHPLVRVLLVEQLYRAMTIINHHPYHRGDYF
ncbi:rRNA large subunit methyltransferase [Moraxella macacae 0408225]|uniref:Ribosomal RNA large subunit methyltransferase H n=1 Tax=Moraxella macacae 0408225 TaxID=1230338 RepID=L2F9C1_9GAMM|nr:23S rRNA (pseudouridine(1915)-N(3))-methyltransferase RlmH [Moraxella macacae]ELA09376.1 rRNA large subunit methyltransferase [Moraxella macacae 0408225]